MINTRVVYRLRELRLPEPLHRFIIIQVPVLLFLNTAHFHTFTVFAATRIHANVLVVSGNKPWVYRLPSVPDRVVRGQPPPDLKGVAIGDFFRPFAKSC